MKEKIQEIPMRLIVTIVVLLVLIAVMIASMQTFARYTTAIPGVVDFTATGRQKAYAYIGMNSPIAADGSAYSIEWNRNENNKENYAHITVSNTFDSILEDDLSARIRIFVPESQGIPSLKIKVDGKTYVGSAVALREGTASYDQLGKGSVYRFVNDKDLELLLNLKGGVQSDIGVDILLEEENINTDMIKIVVETINGNGGDVQ